MNFFDFIKEIGFDRNQTRIEKYRLDGTSNYLISLNHSGVTWAVAIRMPAMGTEYEKFEKEKRRAVDTAKFLVANFGKGIALSDNVRFCFEGSSCLVSYDAVMDFFSFQNALPSLVEIAHVRLKIKPKTVTSLSYPDGIDKDAKLDAGKKEQIKKYLSEYKGDFFVSKGAPASETLDDYWDMVSDVTQALSVLHANSGLNLLVPITDVLSLAKDFDSALTEIASSTNFSEGTSVYESFQKHQKKRNLGNDTRIAELIKKEMLLRTKTGKELLSQLVAQFEQTLKEDKSRYACFTHNDPHCENFVIVKYLYDMKQNNHQYIDREFVNDILEKGSDMAPDALLSIIYNEDYNSLLYRKFEDADTGAGNVNIIYRRTRYDIHLIDIDDASGITHNERKTYLYDLLIYALSVQNLSSIKGGNIQAGDIIGEYYQYISK